MGSILYFAYGSNMLTERLRARCGSAVVNGVAWAQGYELVFTKIGRDGSGKATIAASPREGARVHGVLFELDAADLAVLDRIEGVGAGYERIERFALRGMSCDLELEANTYCATSGHVDPDIVPFDWYKALVLAGARQHKLPANHIRMIEATPVVEDPVADRPSRAEALELLGHAL